MNSPLRWLPGCAAKGMNLAQKANCKFRASPEVWLCCSVSAAVNSDFWELRLPSATLQQCNPIFNQSSFQKYFIAQCESHCTDPEIKIMYLAPIQKSQTFLCRKTDGEMQVKERMKILCQTFLSFQKVIKLWGSLGWFVQWWFFSFFFFFRGWYWCCLFHFVLF